MVQSYKSVQKAYNPNVGINRALYPSNAKNSIQGIPLLNKASGSGSSGAKAASSSTGSGSKPTSSGTGSSGTSSGSGTGVFGGGGLKSINQVGSTSIGSNLLINNLGVLDPGQYSNQNSNIPSDFEINLQQLTTILDAMNLSTDKQKQVLQIYNDMGLGNINTSNIQPFVKNLFTTTLNVDEISSIIDRLVYFSTLKTQVQSQVQQTQQSQPLLQYPSQQPIIIQPPPPIIIQTQVPQVLQTQVPQTPQTQVLHTQVPQTPVPSKLSPQISECNIEIKTVSNHQQYPWVVSIGTNSFQHLQSGVLIGDEWVLTGSNDMQISPEDYIVKVGGINLDNDGEFVIRQVVNIIPHTLYNVWLLQLSSKVSSIKPVTINATNIKFKSGTQIGWGKLTGHGNNTMSLHELEIPLLSRDKCSIFQEQFINNVHLCGGYPECVSLLPCVGDTGSPLLVKFGNQMLLQGISDLSINCQDVQTGMGLWVKIESILSWLQKYVRDLNVMDTSYLSNRERSDVQMTSPNIPLAIIKPGTPMITTTKKISTPQPQSTSQSIPQSQSTCNTIDQQQYIYIFILLLVFTILGVGLFLF